MKMLDPELCKQWLTSRGGRLGLGDVPLIPRTKHTLLFAVPSLPGTQAVLAYRLARWCQTPGALFWMTMWGETLPGEMDLFLDVRGRYKCRDELREAPGCVLEDGDGDALATLLHLLMAFNWEACLFEKSASTAVWMADEIVEVAIADDQRERSLRVLLGELHIAVDPAV